ncbi:OLC1v1005135C1 [Oldenlandia corymbosa var. corymbosa]|uniref:OLC1v1005135C1 n=1 Tax=Oldenlandia corymbosa var. corymbosa TaxID=529605 RepID=A0AAV1DHD7_OLDCO|nr:OLC1v1005135C1 [Oldenlandia corymbosa var. corymbosa]
MANFNSVWEALKMVTLTFILWFHWKALNKIIYEGGAATTQGVIALIQGQVLDMLRVYSIKVKSKVEVNKVEQLLGCRLANPKLRSYKTVRWLLPQTNSNILNSDGSSLSSFDAGYGFLIRDDRGDLIYGETGFLGDACSFKVELAGILFGLCKCFQMKLENVLAQTDNLALALLLQKGTIFLGSTFWL